MACYFVVEYIWVNLEVSLEPFQRHCIFVRFVRRWFICVAGYISAVFSFRNAFTFERG